MNNPSGNDYLGQVARPWAKFSKIGASVTGTVLEEPSARQSRSFETGEPEVWDNGEPKMEVVIPIATDLRDPEVEDDNGERSVVLRVNSLMYRAVQMAMRKSGVKGIYPGGQLTVTYVRDGAKQKGSKLNPPKEYTAVYTPPETSAEDAALNALAGLVQ